METLISNLIEINDDRELRQEEEKSSKNTNAVLEKQKALVIWNTAKKKYVRTSKEERWRKTRRSKFKKIQ